MMARGNEGGAGRKPTRQGLPWQNDGIQKCRHERAVADKGEEDEEWVWSAGRRKLGAKCREGWKSGECWCSSVCGLNQILY